MKKRELILNAMQELLREEKGANCSVSDIAKKAGIAKGGMYYCFESKEDVFDALVERTYADIIENCKMAINSQDVNAIEKLGILFYVYTTSMVDKSLDQYLHQPPNAVIHQKSLAKILTSLTCVFAQIIDEGIEQGLFVCDYSEELAQIILSCFYFLFDTGIFSWTSEQSIRQITALSKVLENELHVPKGSFNCVTYICANFRIHQPTFATH